MFKRASGWLGWPPRVIMGTPISQIELAIEGRVEFVKATNPWGSGDSDDASKKLEDLPPDPEGAARQLMALVERKQRQANRQGKKGGRR